MMRLIVSTRQMFKALWHDTSGIMLPYVTVMLVVLIGGSLLAVDGARYMSLQTQMQNAADALALVGARELNKRTGAQTRATRAIRTNELVTEAVSGMGVASPVVTVCPTCVVFYSALPDASTGFTGTVATGDSDSKFVAVTVDAKTVPTIFPVTFLNAAGANSFSTGARAIAGNAGEQICKVPPVFICNPFETPGNTDDAAATTALENALTPGSIGVRTQFKILNDGNTGPGHFGWLVPPDGCNGANCLKTWISENAPPECFSAGTVDLDTGAKQGALPGFNVRFDIGADASHAPDVNVRKGFVTSGASGNWCNANRDPNDTIPVTNSTRAVAPPEDTVFTNFSNGGSKGNGQWDCATYWSFNHQTAAAPTVRADGSSGVCGTPATTTLSRYDVYTYEVNSNLVGDWSRGTLSNNYAAPPPYNNNRGEIGTPLCAGVGNALPGRRVIHSAVINCEANSPSITPGQTADKIPTAGFVAFFMNEQVPTTGPASTRNLVGEFIGFSNLSGGGVGNKPPIFRDVQLYR